MDSKGEWYEGHHDNKFFRLKERCILLFPAIIKVFWNPILLWKLLLCVQTSAGGLIMFSHVKSHSPSLWDPGIREQWAPVEAKSLGHNGGVVAEWNQDDVLASFYLSSLPCCSADRWGLIWGQTMSCHCFSLLTAAIHLTVWTCVCSEALSGAFGDQETVEDLVRKWLLLFLSKMYNKQTNKE